MSSAVHSPSAPALRDTEDTPLLAERVKTCRAVGDSIAVLRGLAGVAWRVVKSSGYGLYLLQVERKRLHHFIVT